MSRSVRLTVTGDLCSVRFAVPQLGVISGSLREIVALTISPARMAVQFGFTKADFEELAERLGPVPEAGAELAVTLRDLRLIYLALWQVPEMFGSEESFYIRLGFFKEEAYGLARQILTAVDRAVQ